MRRRVAFARSHEGKTAAAWKTALQAVADLKKFTYYPADIRSKFLQLRYSPNARQLGVSEATLRTHVRRLYAKSGTRRLPELVLFLNDPRWLDPI